MRGRPDGTSRIEMGGTDRGAALSNLTGPAQLAISAVSIDSNDRALRRAQAHDELADRERGIAH